MDLTLESFLDAEGQDASAARDPAGDSNIVKEFRLASPRRGLFKVPQNSRKV